MIKVVDSKVKSLPLLPLPVVIVFIRLPMGNEFHVPRHKWHLPFEAVKEGQKCISTLIGMDLTTKIET